MDKPADGIDPTALFNLSYGVYAVSTDCDDRLVGCIANSAMQITSEPPTLAVSLNHDNFTNHCVYRSGRFALSIFGEDSKPDQIGALGFFSSRDKDKFVDIDHVLVDGLPVLSDALAYGLFKVIDTMETATHTVFLGEMYASGNLRKGTPMTYKYYREVIKGKTAKNAPTYVETKHEEEKKMADKVWRCSVCGYVYDGDTPFEELDDSWTCPICGVAKDMFELVDADSI